MNGEQQSRIEPGLDQDVRIVAFLVKKYAYTILFSIAIASEWHHEKNGSDLSTESIGEGSKIKVWWRCPRVTCPYGCRHDWESQVHTRCLRGSSCPFCSTVPYKCQICRHQSVAHLRPDIARGWHPTQNGTCSPFQYSLRSNFIAWWRCSKNSQHEWKTSIAHRTYGTACPMCFSNFSQIAMTWLRVQQAQCQFQIRHGESDLGEFQIPETRYKCDGYCEETKTVYEFHGNPAIFEETMIHPIIKKTFRELYDKTLQKEQKIKELGYTYLSITTGAVTYPCYRRSSQ